MYIIPEYDLFCFSVNRCCLILVVSSKFSHFWHSFALIWNIMSGFAGRGQAATAFLEYKAKDQDLMTFLHKQYNEVPIP